MQPKLSYLKEIGFPVDRLQASQIYEPTGCEKCRSTGFKGRGGIFEMLQVSDAIESLIISRASSNEIKQKSMAEGMTTLRSDGFNKVLSGFTTLEEVLRVTEEND